MADVEKLVKLMTAYSVGVRGGVITPCLQDEEDFRKRLGLGPAPDAVKDDWAKSNGVRAPITLARGVGKEGEEADKEAADTDTDTGTTEEE